MRASTPPYREIVSLRSHARTHARSICYSGHFGAKCRRSVCLWPCGVATFSVCFHMFSVIWTIFFDNSLRFWVAGMACLSCVLRLRFFMHESGEGRSEICTRKHRVRKCECSFYDEFLKVEVEFARENTCCIFTFCDSSHAKPLLFNMFSIILCDYSVLCVGFKRFCVILVCF